MNIAEHIAVSNKKTSTNTYLYLTFIIAILASVWLQVPRLTDPFSVEEDFRSFHWMLQFQDRERFQDDPLVYSRVIEFDIGPMHLVMDSGSPGYSLLFQLASYVMPVVLFSKLLVFPLLMISVYFVYKIGEMIGDGKSALVLSLAFIVFSLASPTSISPIGGLQRSFSLPLLLALVYYLMIRNDWAAAIVLVLSGLIYPPVFVLGSMTYGLSLMEWQEEYQLPTVNWQRLVPFVVAIVMVILILLPSFLVQLEDSQTAGSDSFNDNYSLLSDPNHLAGGRRLLFNIFPIVGRGGLTVQGINIIHIFILSLFSTLIFFLRPASLAEFPYALKLLFFAGLLCFALAWIIALVANSFLLYLPSRYTQASLFIVPMVYVFANARDSFNIAARKLVSNRQRIFFLTIPVIVSILGLALFLPKSSVLTGGRYQGLRLLLVVLAVILMTLTAIATRPRQPTDLANSNPIKSSSRKPLVAFALVWLFIGFLYMKIVQVPFYVATEEERQLFSFMESLPEDILIAGNPCDLDGVPLFAGQAVQSSCESPNPDQTVVLAGLEAYYAESAEEIVDYCLEYGVDYLVVNRSSFSRAAINGGNYFFEPYDSHLRSKLTSQSTFALNAVASEDELFKTGNLFVVRCNSSSLE